jgi:hypothetical protein
MAPVGQSEHRNAGNFKIQENIIAGLVVTTALTTEIISYANVSLWVLTGNLYLDMLGRTDLSTTNGLKCPAGTLIEFYTQNQITFMSDGSGATVQIIVWED